jgi:hypothetical protein
MVDTSHYFVRNVYARFLNKYFYEYSMINPLKPKLA